MCLYVDMYMSAYVFSPRPSQNHEDLNHVRRATRQTSPPVRGSPRLPNIIIPVTTYQKQGEGACSGVTYHYDPSNTSDLLMKALSRGPHRIVAARPYLFVLEGGRQHRTTKYWNSIFSIIAFIASYR